MLLIIVTLNRTYSKLKTLSENQMNRLLEAMSVREKETLEASRHSIQCERISTKDYFDCSVHGIHLDTCYKSLTKIMCPSKKSKLQDTLPQGVQRAKRQKRSSSTADLFPTSCFKYNVGRRKIKGKIVVPHKVTLQSAALKLKLTAIKSNDEPCIIQFNARDTSVKDFQYLMEKEIRTHNDCYTEYVHCLQEKPKDQNLSSPADVTGDFDAVRKFINDNILHCNNAVSMMKFHILYKTDVDYVSLHIEIIRSN